MKRAIVGIAFLVIGVSFAHSQPRPPVPLDAASLGGQTLNQLRVIFPSARLSARKDAFQVDDWTGWRLIRLGFNTKGQLFMIGFDLQGTLSETEARRLVGTALKVSIPSTQPEPGDLWRRWADLPGPISAVTLYRERRLGGLSPTTEEFRASGIGITYDIGPTGQGWKAFPNPEQPGR